MAQSLYSDDCTSTSEANAMFATEKGLLVLRPSGGCCSTYFTVPSGCYALVTRHGADLDYVRSDGTTSAVWPAGLHFPNPPWIGVGFLVTKETIVIDLPVKACKTKDNVTVNVDMAMSFRIMGDESKGEDPELVRNFVYAVKPKGLEQQLRDAQEEAVRACARSLKHTDIYGIRSGGKVAANSLNADGSQEGDDSDDDVYRDPIFEGEADEFEKAKSLKATEKGIDVTENMRSLLNKQFVPQGIYIESVIMKTVTLPVDISQQMSDKTMVISQNAAQRMYHENEMQKERMDQKEATLMQTYEEQREQERSDGAKKVNEEEVKLNDMKSQAFKAEANIRENTHNMIQNMNAESSLKVQRIKDNETAAVVKIHTEAEKEAAELLANTNLEVQTLLSSSQVTSAQNNAKAALFISMAEGKIAPWIEKKKAYETEMKKLEVYENLSRNDKLIVNGSDDDGVNLIAVADSILSELDNADNVTSKVLAEMSIMKSGASAFMSKTEPTMA